MRLMQNTPHRARESYSERLAPSLWMLISIALVGPMAALAFAPVTPGIAVAVGAAVSLLLVVLSVALSPVVRVNGTVLYAGRAHIDVRWLGEPEHFTGQDAKDRRTCDIDRNGWYLFRGGIEGVVVVPITDPDDPVRSWTISSRTPDRLDAAIRSARTERGS